MGSIKVITGKVRFSYANVWEPTAVEEGAEKKYNVSILIPKSDTKTLAKINEAIDQLKKEVMASNNGKLPKGFKLPLRDGDVDREDDDAYAGHYFMSASSKRQPTIIDRDKDEILDKSEFYSGVYGRASVNFYTFSVPTNKGIAVGLNHLQKLADGEPLAGGSSAEEDFDDDFDDDDDLMG